MDRLSRACVRIIDRYQASEAAHAVDGRCRFEPSCCTYMREAFTTRAFPVAWVMSTWRVLRCNPLTRPRSVDPLVRTSRRPRPSAIRTGFASLLLAGFVTMLIGGAAGAQTISGPCTGTINGRHPATLTKDNPLVVTQGQRVAVSGTLQGADAETRSVTRIQVDIISGLYSASRVDPGRGPTWGGSVNVDEYLKRGSGLYRVHGTASASGLAPCAGDGYVKLDGGKLILAVAAGVGTVGLAGSLVSPGIARSEVQASTIVPDAAPEMSAYPRRQVIGGCCVMTALALPLLMVGGGGDPGGPTGGGEQPPGTPSMGRRVWKRGHAVWGFISGLLFGIGLTVVLQQQAMWILDIWTAIVLPVGLAILAAIRAWIGRPYEIRESAP